MYWKLDQPLLCRTVEPFQCFFLKKWNTKKKYKKKPSFVTYHSNILLLTAKDPAKSSLTTLFFVSIFFTVYIHSHWCIYIYIYKIIYLKKKKRTRSDWDVQWHVYDRAHAEMDNNTNRITINVNMYIKILNSYILGKTVASNSQKFQFKVQLKWKSINYMATAIFASLVRVWASRDTTLSRTTFRAVF